MSRKSRAELVTAIGQTMMRWQDATEAFDEAVGRLYELNSADRRCLSFVSLGPQTASAIAKETALTPASVTTLIDRLERRQLVYRRADASDRRKVLVEATDTARKLIARTYLPIAQAGAELLMQYSLKELMVIQRFLAEALALQKRMMDELIAREGQARRQ